MQHNIDAKRLLCPLPVIRLGEKIEQIQSGDLVEIIATDPGVLFDIPAWCKVHGHKILKINEKTDGIIVILVEKIG
ncbi:MAG: recombinase [Candidatus Thioglobus sp.]|nr:recombinase [Candidatus Thioglobus sp.]